MTNLNKPARVLIAEDDGRLREVLLELLSASDAVEVVAVATNAVELATLLSDHHPDVAVVDTRLLSEDASDAVAQILRHSPATKLVCMSASADPSRIAGFLSSGAVGYIVKGQDHPSVLEAIKRAATGETVIPREVLNVFMEDHDSSGPDTQSDPAPWTSLVSALEAERRRIAGDIHDDPLQIMAVASMRLGMLRDRLTDPALQEVVDQTRNSVQAAVGRLRSVLFELRPHALELDGLAAAIQVYLEETLTPTGIKFSFESELTCEPAEVVQAVVYRIAQEALTNARKHSKASLITVRLWEQDEGIWLQVTDDGVGFDSDSPACAGHLGRATMRDRAALAAGLLQTFSGAGEGTRILAWVPNNDQE